MGGLSSLFKIDNRKINEVAAKALVVLEDVHALIVPEVVKLAVDLRALVGKVTEIADIVLDKPTP